MSLGRMLISSPPTDALQRAQLTQRAAHEILRETAPGKDARNTMRDIRKNEEVGKTIKNLLTKQQRLLAQIPGGGQEEKKEESGEKKPGETPPPKKSWLEVVTTQQ